MTVVLAPSPQQEESWRRPTRRRAVDQTLCAAAHVAEGFAEYAVHIMDGPPRAGAPSLTEDPVALLRHATAARRLRGYREWVCCLIALAVGGAVVAQLAGEIGYGAAVAAVGVGIAGWAARQRLRRGLRALVVWAWRRHRDRCRSGPVRGVIVVALVAAMSLPFLLRQPVLWDCADTALVGLAAGWLVVVAESTLAHHRAAAIVVDGSPPPRGLARPLTGQVEERLDQLSDANVIVYGEPRAAAPFVGNGLVVRPWELAIDVRRRKADGNADAFALFDVVAFHEWLEAGFRIENAVESTSSRRLTSGHRLYVDGRKVHWESALLAADPPVPQLRIDWDVLADELRHPERSEDRRVYFYVQEIARDGEIGVCIFLRPLLQNGRLSLEFVPLVIPPVHPDVEALIDGLPARTRDQVARAARIWTPRACGAVFGSPVRCLARVRAGLRRWASRQRWRLAARYGWFYDHGAVMSVREGVSWREPNEFDHFVIRDLVRINDQLRDRLLASIKTYLEEVGVDTEEWDTSVTITSIQNWNVGNVRADMVGFGNNNTFGSPGRETDGGETSG